MLDYAQARRLMVDCQLRTFDVNDVAVLDAFDSVPRERFVPPGREDFAYIDQTLTFDGGLVSKAVSLESARERLKAMRGRTHQLHSGAALATKGQIVWSGVDTVQMRMRDFSDAFLDAYLAAEGEALLSCVGSYRLEGLGSQLFEAVDGDYFTVLGLPLWPVLKELRRAGVIAA